MSDELIPGIRPRVRVLHGEMENAIQDDRVYGNLILYGEKGVPRQTVNIYHRSEGPVGAHDEMVMRPPEIGHYPKR